MEFDAAGFLFIEHGRFLAGFQKKTQRWTGFGGKKKCEETSEACALRETIEELFEVSLKKEDLETFLLFLNLPIPQYKGSYVYYVFTPNAILEISYLLEKNGYKSPLYIKMPRTLDEFIDTRWCTTNAEMENVQFFHTSELQDLKGAFDRHFFNDLQGEKFHETRRS